MDCDVLYYHFRRELGLEGLDHANCFMKTRADLLGNCHLYRSLKFIEKEGHISIHSLGQ